MLLCYCHVATHHARELAREGKAKPRPAVAARGQGISLGEFLEQFGPLFGGQAGNRYLRALFVPEEDLGIPGFLKREQQPTADRACSVSCTARRLNWPGPVSYRAFFIQDAHLSILRRAASLLRAFSLRVY
jgi:hypothetical protein